MRSTQEWEAALEGAHLDGVALNWLDNGRDPVTGQDLGARIVYYDGGHAGGEIDLPSGGLICESVPGDVAALFTLSPEAVAEVVRLRKAIEDRIRLLRLPLCSHMPEGDELDDLAEQWNRQSYEAEVLTRILEDTHE